MDPRTVEAERSDAERVRTPDHASRYTSASCALTADTNCSVQMTAVGTPRRSSSIPSCKLHVLHDPQSPMAVTTTSHSRARASSIASSATRLALDFVMVTTRLI